MNKICLFSSFSEEKYLLNYQKYYLESLVNNFSEVVLITNLRNLNKESLDFLDTIGCKLFFVTNEGLDFGMWYKYIKSNKDKICKYDYIAFVNDSCLMIDESKLRDFIQWSEFSHGDYCGLVNSQEISPHLQSHFVFVKKQCYEDLFDYYEKNGIYKQRKDIVWNYEVGISKMFLEKGYKLTSFINEKYAYNYFIYNARRILNLKIPFIKKKLILNGFDFEYRWFHLLKNSKSKPFKQFGTKEYEEVLEYSDIRFKYKENKETIIYPEEYQKAVYDYLYPSNVSNNYLLEGLVN